VGDATAQVLAVGADGLKGIEEGDPQLVAVVRGSVGKALFGELPDSFVGVELRGVGGQSDEMEPLGSAAELSNEASAVRSATIPEDEDVAAEMPEQVAQEVTGLQLADVVVVKLEEEIQAPAPGGDGEARDRRDPVAPIEMAHQRRLSHRSPRLGDGRGQEEARFIGENEVGAQPGDVFFTRGQSSRKNLPMLFSSLSRARLLGFWWLQPRLCISRPT
jgi:hypothetical protein